MNYTKGEWEVSPVDFHVFIPNHGAIADCYKHEANAHLISAAPEMYEACVLILSNMRTLSAASTEYKNLFANQIPVMEKALAKAEGVN